MPSRLCLVAVPQAKVTVLIQAQSGKDSPSFPPLHPQMSRLGASMQTFPTSSVVLQRTALRARNSQRPLDCRGSRDGQCPAGMDRVLG